MTANNRNNRDRDPKAAESGSGFGGDHDRDRWTNSPKGPAPRSRGSAGGGDFERDRAYAEGVTAGDKAEDADAADPETTNAGAEGTGEDTSTADQITGPDAGDERYGAARDRERQRTGNIGQPGAQKPDGTK